MNVLKLPSFIFPSFRRRLFFILAAFSVVLFIGLLVRVELRADEQDLRETPYVRAVKAAWPSVVSIRAEKEAEDDFSSSDGSRRVNGMGAGVIIDPRGFVLTNYHVVEDVREITVTTTAGDQYEAELFAKEPLKDLAILRIDADVELGVVPIGKSSDLMIAEPVIAIGNPYGYSQTVTTGIISSLHRALQVSDAQYYDDLIQTNADINPGNSGGPLFNINGRMIGLIVAVRTGAQGIGFAIPVDEVLRVTSRMLETEIDKRCRHGISLSRPVIGPGGLSTETLVGPVVPASHTTDIEDIVVAEVEEDSPAAQAGLLPGDRIRKVDDIDVEHEFDFYRALLDVTPDDTVHFEVQRGDSLVECDMSLQPLSVAWTMLGLNLASISVGSFAEQYSSTDYRGGLLVADICEGGLAEQSGVKRGDVLVGLHIWETVSLGNANYILSRSDLKEYDPLKFTILRDGRALYGYLDFGAEQVEEAASETVRSGSSETVVSSSHAAF
jgi:serine protease Do